MSPQHWLFSICISLSTIFIHWNFSSISVCTLLAAWQKQLDGVYSFHSLLAFVWSQTWWWSQSCAIISLGWLRYSRREMAGLGLREKQPRVSQTLWVMQWLKRACFNEAVLLSPANLHTDIGAHDEAERWCGLGSWLRGPVLPGHQIVPICPSRCWQLSSAVAKGLCALCEICKSPFPGIASYQHSLGLPLLPAAITSHLCKNVRADAQWQASDQKYRTSQWIFLVLFFRNQWGKQRVSPSKTSSQACLWVLLLHSRHCTIQNVDLSDMNAVGGSKIHKTTTTPQDNEELLFAFHLLQCKSLTSWIAKCHTSSCACCK